MLQFDWDELPESKGRIAMYRIDAPSGLFGFLGANRTYTRIPLTDCDYSDVDDYIRSI